MNTIMHPIQLRIVQYEYVLNWEGIESDYDGINGGFSCLISFSKRNPLEDRLFLSINSFYLDDATFESFIKEIFAITTRYTKQPSLKDKDRMITVISFPAGK